MNLKKEFENIGLSKKGHFLLTSGRHSNTYFNKDLIYQHPSVFRYVVKELTEQVAFVHDSASERSYAIVGPAISGAVIASSVAYSMGLPLAYPEKTSDDGFEFRRGFDTFLSGRKIILVEDIITTGGSVMKTIDSVKQCGGLVEQIVAIWNRGGWRPPAEIWLSSLINETATSYQPDKCPLCKNKTPLTNPKLS